MHRFTVRMSLGPVVALAALAGAVACNRTVEPSEHASNEANTLKPAPPLQPLNALLPDAILQGERPTYRAGAVKPWEGGELAASRAWSIHPGGSIQHRVPLASWESPAVGQTIAVSLVHDAAAASSARAAGQGFRL